MIAVLVDSIFRFTCGKLRAESSLTNIYIFIFLKIHFLKRNQHLMEKGLATVKTTKTGTTIVGLIYKVLLVLAGKLLILTLLHSSLLVKGRRCIGS